MFTGCMLNLNNGEIRYSKNGEDLGVAFKLDQSRRSDCYFPSVVLKNAELSFNFGSTPFKVSIIVNRDKVKSQTNILCVHMLSILNKLIWFHRLSHSFLNTH